MLTLCNIHWCARGYGNKTQQLTMGKGMDHISQTIKLMAAQMSHYNNIIWSLWCLSTSIHLTYQSDYISTNCV